VRVRQRDIAQAAGVSQASVSLVVSGRAADGGVSAGTQERIRRAMSELGYVPDAAARSLRGGRNGLLGVFTYEPVFPSQPDDYFHEFLVGIEVAAAQRGQDLVLFSSAQQADGRRSIFSGGASRLHLADGSIILGLHRVDDELRRLVDDDYPFVSLGRYDPVPEAAWVAVDYDRAVRSIIDDLHAAGHESFVYVAGDDERLPSRARREAFLAATRDDTSVIVGGSELGIDQMKDWVQQGVTTVIAENPLIAEGVAMTATRASLRIPERLSAVSLEVPLRNGRAAGWSHLVIPKRDVGVRTVGLLAAILDGKLPRGHHETIQCLPHHLATIAPPASAS